MNELSNRIACYHLPGLFEFYELYWLFLPLFREHPEYFYDWCEIGSVYGAPGDCIWGGGRVGGGDSDPREVLELLCEYGISARLTFSNSLLREEHLADEKCNALCRLFEESEGVPNGVIGPFGTAFKLSENQISGAVYGFFHNEGTDGF